MKFLDSAVNKYFRVAVLERDVAVLREAGYHVVRGQASAWLSEDDAHTDLARMFDFPDYYGRNWDAFNDCLRDVRAHAYGFPADAAGVVMVLTGFDAFAARCPREARLLLDVYVNQQRYGLIRGAQLICFVQSDDPRLRLDAVGGMVPQWNSAEWFDSKRLP